MITLLGLWIKIYTMSDRYTRNLTYSSSSYKSVIPKSLVDSEDYESAIFQYAKDIDEVKDKDIVIRLS